VPALYPSTLAVSDTGWATLKEEIAMATDLTVILEDQPGTLADLGEATGKANINIEGMCAVTREGKGEIHVLVEDTGATRSALADAGLDVSDEREVLVVDVEDRPGTMSAVARRLSDAGVNIELAYTTFGGIRIVLGVDDVDKGRAAL
jgi:hypothetical protein